MRSKTRLWTTAFFSVSLALAGCMKSGDNATGVIPESSAVLDADHGGARIVLPDIDPAALGKAGKDTTVRDTTIRDTTVKAWFELSITGENMMTLSFRFPLTNKGNGPYEIKGIPAGKSRSFHGSLFNANGILTHEGITQADIVGGAFTEIRLFLAKASGSAEVCVVIEGQKLPPCAGKDTLMPPPKPGPGPDSGAVGGCWQLSSSWVSGKVKLYDSMLNGSMGMIRRDSGADLYFTTWGRHGDSLLAIVVSPDRDQKWLFSGVVAGNNEGWMGVLSNYTTGKSTPFGAKSLSCAVVTDSGKAIPDSVPPPKPVPTGSIPMPGSGAPRTTLCFDMRFDYGNGPCETQGVAKMDFLDGKILYGNITVADVPSHFYSSVMGSYDAATIRFYGVTADEPGVSRDTLSLQGNMSLGANMAKGDYVRWPSGKRGNWTMSLVACGSGTFKTPDPSCTAK